MASTVNKHLFLLFYLGQRRKRKQRYRKKYWIRDTFRSRFLFGEYHTLVEIHLNKRVLACLYALSFLYFTPFSCKLSILVQVLIGCILYIGYHWLE